MRPRPLIGFGLDARPAAEVQRGSPVRRASCRVAWGCTLAVFLQQGLPCLAQTPAVAPADRTNSAHLIDLPATLRLANARNLDIQIARERLREANANHTSATEQFFPWLAPGAAYSRHEGRIQAIDGPMLDADKQLYTVGAGLTAWMNLGDAIYNSLATKQLVSAADQGLESQRQDSTLAAAQGYFDLARNQALVDVIREALRISQDYQRQLHDAVEAGIAFKGDELRVQVQTERYQLALRQAREQQRVTAARLAQVLHLDASVDLVPLDTDLVPIPLISTNLTLESLLERAIRTRPELKQNQALVGAAQAAKNGSVYGPLIPSVGAQAVVGGLGGGPVDNSGGLARSEDFAVTLGWRIGPGGLFDVGRVRASDARLEATRLTGEKLRDEVLRQVVESHARVNSLLDQLATTRQNLATSSETLRLTRQRKQFGVGAVLEDIQAQQELARARSDHLTAIAEFNKAQYALAKAIGGVTDAEKP